MAKRIIEASPEELATLGGRALLESICAAGGRTISAEVVAFRPALVDGVSNAGLAATLGADIIHLNHYDVDKPMIAGLLSTEEGLKVWEKSGLRVAPMHDIEEPVRRFLSEMGLGVTIRDLRALIGRVVGVSLEVVADGINAPPGRLATPETAVRAIEQGAAYITLVATPAITPETLRANVRRLREGVGPEAVLVTGRMPWGESRGDVPRFLNGAEIKGLVDAGADVLMLPAPGTVPGATVETVTATVETVRRLGALAEVTIGTSQESADVETVRRLALDGKLTGADIYQIGDGGYCGMAIPENIQAFATAIKGKRHTYRRMASAEGAHLKGGG